MTEDFTPRFVGDRSRPLSCTFTTHDGSIDSLAGASGLQMKFRDIQTGIVTTGTGTWAIQGDGTAGIAIYAWGAADVATAGFFRIWPDATMTDGPANWDDTHILEIRPIT